MSLVRLAFRHASGLLLSVLFVCLLGVVALRGMPAAILPDFPYPRLVVIGRAGDLAIQDMIARVTRPLEAAAGGVPGATTVRSRTSRGAVELSIDFNWGSDMFEALTRLNGVVAAARSSLPAAVELQVEWVNPSSFPVIGYSLTSTSHSPRELRELAALTLAPALNRLPGVYRVLVQGGQVREYQVLLDPRALAAAGLRPEQVAAALAATNQLQAVGRLTRHGQSTLVLASAQIERPEQIGDVVVVDAPRAAQGASPTAARPPVRIRDIARVREGNAEEQQVVTADGHEAVLLNLLKQPGASTADVSRAVATALRDLRSALPTDVTVRAFYDEADLLRESMGSLQDSILIGAALAMLVLLGFLRSWRSAVVVLLCLPTTVLIALLCLRLAHQTLNLMTLGGLAVGLGLIIDDVVVTLENIYRHLEMGKSPRQAALDGTTEIQKPMVGSTITTVAVFLPLAFLGGITGAFFAPLTLTLTILLLVSVLLAVVVVPIIAAGLLRGHRRDEAVSERGAGEEGAPLYARVVRWCLAHPAVVVGVVVGGAIGGAFIFRTLPTGFMPEMDEGAFVLDYLAPQGTSLEATDRQVRIIESELRVTPEIAAYARRTGLEMGFFATDPNRGDISVKLKPRSERRRSMAEVMEDVHHRCEARLPGMTIELVAPLADRVADIAGEPSPIEVKFFGDDPAVLSRLGEQASDIISHVRGTMESIHQVTRSGPELLVRIDPARAGRLGLTPEDVIQTLDTDMFGRASTVARRGERAIPIRVLLPPGERRSVAQVSGLPLLSAAGSVPLAAVADLSEGAGSEEMVRENQKPVVAATAGLEGRDLGSANAEVRRRIAREVRLPPGYTVQYGGLYQTQQESFRSLLMVLLLGAFLVFIAMVFQYGRFIEPTALLLTGGMALAGVVAALRVTGTPFNASSFTGAIMIFGMVLTNGIVLMDVIREQVRALQGGAETRDASARVTRPELAEAIVRAGTLRLRPVLMTAAIAVLTLLPLALGVGSGAEMQRPLAIAVIGGLVVSPVFTLLVAPTLLLLFSGRVARSN